MAQLTIYAHHQGSLLCFVAVLIGELNVSWHTSHRSEVVNPQSHGFLKGRRGLPCIATLMIPGPPNVDIFRSKVDLVEIIERLLAVAWVDPWHGHRRSVEDG
jgi:hypothetical protein